METIVRGINLRLISTPPDKREYIAVIPKVMRPKLITRPSKGLKIDSINPIPRW